MQWVFVASHANRNTACLKIITVGLDKNIVAICWVRFWRLKWENAEVVREMANAKPAEELGMRKKLARTLTLGWLMQTVM